MKRRVNKLTEGSNLLWESSRMMLPEHKDNLRRHRQQLDTYTVKPLLDEQRLEELTYLLELAVQDKQPICLHLHDGQQETKLAGSVHHLDAYARTLYLNCDGHLVAIPLHHIMDLQPLA